MDNNKITVRISTCYWSDDNGIYMKKSIRYLKRKSNGFNHIADEACNADAQTAMQNILNLQSCKDGVYEVVTANISTDFETGHIDDWNYMLAEVKE